MRKYIITCLILGSLSVFSCSDNTESEGFTPCSLDVSGKVEKGPFVSGSTITMQLLNAKMEASGETYVTTILDNSGSFSFGTKYFETQYADLMANGYYFNEVSGNLSTGTLNLRGLVDLSDQSTINVNILTHLKYQRVLNLIKGGKDFKAANSQAQKELFAAFGLSEYADTDASNLTISNGDNEAAALIAVSSLLLSERSDAELTEYLAKLCQEFGQNGEFSAESKNQIKEDRGKLIYELEYIKRSIIDRYADLGETIEVKDLDK